MEGTWLSTLIVLFVLVGNIEHAGCKSYSIEELNSVNVTVGMPYNEFISSSIYKETIFELIAENITLGCALPKETCKLEPKYSRKSEAYRREITTESYNFTGSQVGELLPPRQLGTTDKTTLVIYLHTTDTYDFLKWTYIVKILYASTSSINDKFNTTMGNPNIIAGIPTSYIAQVIAEDMVAPAVISGVMLGAAALMFVILVPLSNTKYCRKMNNDGKKDIEEGNETNRSEDQVERF